MIRGGNNLESENINVRYEHQNNSNYLVIEDDNEYQDYQYKMLKRNKPDHFLKMSMYSVNGRYGIYYDITSKQQLNRFYEYGKMTMDDVKSICVNLSEMVRIADDYMLDIDHVKIEPKYLYMDVGTRKIYFVYHTRVNSNTFNEELKILFEFILEHFDHSLEKECIVKLYEVYQKVLVGDYDPYNLIRMFGGIEKDKYKEKVVHENIEEDIEEYKEKEIISVFPEQIKVDKEEKVTDKVVSRKVIVGTLMIAFGLVNIILPDMMPINIPSLVAFVSLGSGIGILFYTKKHHVKENTVTIVEKEEVPYVIKEKREPEQKDKTDVYDDMCNETILLSDYIGASGKKKTLKLHMVEDDGVQNPLMHTKELENISTIEMDKYPYVIGSFDKMADVIVEAQVISRMHCCIYKDKLSEDIYAVEDLNATNGTYVNGERLNNHEKRQLFNGDILKLAAVSFKVEIS